jgi:GntR family transcriptional regulator of arabinose operon
METRYGLSDDNSGKNDNLRYRKLYNWGRTLIISGILKKGDKFPSEHILARKFGYSRQTVRTAMNRLEEEGLISRVRGSGTYVEYKNEVSDAEKPHIGLIMSYYADYLFPQVYAGIASVLEEKGIKIDVAVTKNRLNDESMYLEGFLSSNVSGLIIEGTGSAFPNPNIRLYEEIRQRNIPTLFIHNHYPNQDFDSVEMADEKCGYELTNILLQNGHRRIGGIFKYDDMQGVNRYYGFIKCLSDHGIQLDGDCIQWYSTRDMEYEFSKKNQLSFLRRTKDCTAMMLYNDEVCEKYIDFLRERGISVPDDMSVVAFDDAALTENKEFRILSAVHPKYELGRLTARNLLRMMENKDWQNDNYSHRFPVLINNGNSVKDIRN